MPPLLYIETIIQNNFILMLQTNSKSNDICHLYYIYI